MRDAFGFFPVEIDRCCVTGCHEQPTQQRATQTTDQRFCDRHAADYDAGRLVGSKVFGYRRKVDQHDPR